jgi:hypothetical protein
MPIINNCPAYLVVAKFPYLASKDPIKKVAVSYQLPFYKLLPFLKDDDLLKALFLYQAHPNPSPVLLSFGQFLLEEIPEKDFPNLYSYIKKTIENEMTSPPDLSEDKNLVIRKEISNISDAAYRNIVSFFMIYSKNLLSVDEDMVENISDIISQNNPVIRCNINPTMRKLLENYE